MRLAAAGAGGGLLLVACSGSVDVGGAPPNPTGTVATRCAALVAEAPGSVAGQASRDVSPASRYVAAWGDPPIVLRCGVPRPRALTPTSRCFVVDGVGWLATQDGVEVEPTRASDGTLEFTTVGRSAYVEVTVPDSYQPAADALVDLAGTVAEHTTQRRACR